MRHLLLSMLAVAASLGAAQARAQPSAVPPRVEGELCHSALRNYDTVWRGYFTGERDSPFAFEDRVYRVTKIRCFRTRAECEAWQYWNERDSNVWFRTTCEPIG